MPKTTEVTNLASPAPIPELEPHYTCREVAEILKLNERTVRNIFHDEAGVLRYGSKGKRVTLRIPKSVYLRVYNRLTKG